MLIFLDLMNKYVKYFVVIFFYLFVNLFASHLVEPNKNFRNPFSFFQGSTKNKNTLSKSNTSKLFKGFPITLGGIIQVDNNFAAILKKKNKQEVVFLGDNIWGYSVEKITQDHVVVSKKGKNINLLIDI